MKKSLWIAAVAMAVGFGVSTQATTNATFGTWNFEGPAAGTVVPPSGMTNVGYGSWAADTNNGVAYVTNTTTPDGAQAVYFDGSITNSFSISALDALRFKTGFLLKPGQLEDLTLTNNVDANARLAFYFNTASNLVLMHGDNGNWQVSTVSGTQYGSNDWVSIVIDQDYSVVQGGRRYFTLWVNGANVSNANGYVRTGDSFASGGGYWFQMKSAGSSPYGMNSLVGMGIGMLDAVSNTLVMSQTQSETFMDYWFNLNTAPENYATWAACAAGDADGDGINNLDESIAGTNPTNANQYLKIDSISIAGNDVTVTFEGSSLGASSSFSYELWGADLAGGTYSNLSITRTKTAGTLSVTNTTTETPKFYKVILPYTE